MLYKFNSYLKSHLFEIPGILWSLPDWPGQSASLSLCTTKYRTLLWDPRPLRLETEAKASPLRSLQVFSVPQRSF